MMIGTARPMWTPLGVAGWQLVMQLYHLQLAIDIVLAASSSSAVTHSESGVPAIVLSISESRPFDFAWTSG